MPKNLEIKARITSKEKAIDIAKTLPSNYSGELLQTDTYFITTSGRLKLREINQKTAELIYYNRIEDLRERMSDFQIFPTDNPKMLKTILSDSFGIKTVVKKQRQLYLYNDTRIHIDTVEQLGAFIEFEVPVNSGEEDAHKKMQFLVDRFGLKKDDFILKSYSDLLDQNHG